MPLCNKERTNERCCKRSIFGSVILSFGCSQLGQLNGDSLRGQAKLRTENEMTSFEDDPVSDFSRFNSKSMNGSEARKRPGNEYMENEKAESYDKIPPIRIVMLVVGTRGDIQPFLAIGRKLQVFSLKLNSDSHKYIPCVCSL